MTDEEEHLVKLLSLVTWSDEEHCGLRFVSAADDVNWRAPAGEYLHQLAVAQTDEEVAAATTRDASDKFPAQVHEVCERYAGALRDDRTDIRELPLFVLEVFTDLPDHLVPFFGEMVAMALLVPKFNSRAAGRMWVEDLLATAWRVAVSRTKHAVAPSY